MEFIARAPRSHSHSPGEITVYPDTPAFTPYFNLTSFFAIAYIRICQ